MAAEIELELAAAAPISSPPWPGAAKEPVRRYVVPVDAGVDALEAVDVHVTGPGAGGATARSRAAVLFGAHLVWAGVVPAAPRAPRLTCGGINLLRARADGREVVLLVSAPADADVRVVATVRPKLEGGEAVPFAARSLFFMG